MTSNRIKFVAKLELRHKPITKNLIFQETQMNLGYTELQTRICIQTQTSEMPLKYSSAVVKQ